MLLTIDVSYQPRTAFDSDAVISRLLSRAVTKFPQLHLNDSSRSMERGGMQGGKERQQRVDLISTEHMDGSMKDCFEKNNYNSLLQSVIQSCS